MGCLVEPLLTRDDIEYMLTFRMYSWVRCCKYPDYCDTKGRSLHCEWSKEMDHQRHLG